MRGLVLEGGGAKGAYSFGCLKAFADRGISFDVVSGTSVGALNALIWSTGQVEYGAAIWRSLSFAAIYPCRRPRPLWLTLGVAVFFVNTAVDAMRGVQSPGATFWRRAAYGILCGLVAYLFADEVIGLRPWTFWGLADSALPITAAIVTLWHIRHNVTLRRNWLLLMSFLALFITTLKLLGDKQEPLTSVRAALVHWMDVLVFTICSFLTAMYVLWWYAKRCNISTLQSSPLREKLGCLTSKVLTIPTVVCTAYESVCFDPDHVVLLASPGTEDSPPRVMRDDDVRVFPEYHLLNELAENERADVALASAALPFGVVPNVQVLGRRRIDGGLADNIPIYPLIQDLPCSEIVVLCLRPLEEAGIGSDDEIYTPRDWAKTRRSLAVAARPKPNGPLREVENDPPQIIPYEQPTSWPRRVHVIRPAHSLGNFLRGTMNFSSTYAKRLMAMGYADAMIAIESLHLAQAPATATSSALPPA